MATHGKIGLYDSAAEDWTAYTERLEQYFLANDVTTAEKQRAISFKLRAVHLFTVSSVVWLLQKNPLTSLFNSLSNW